MTSKILFTVAFWKFYLILVQLLSKLDLDEHYCNQTWVQLCITLKSHYQSGDCHLNTSPHLLRDLTRVISLITKLVYSLIIYHL